MPKAGGKKPTKKTKTVAKPETKKENNESLQGTRGKLSEVKVQELLLDVALKPGNITIEAIAEKYGINRQTLWQIRRERSNEIRAIQNDFIEQHSGDVYKALIESAKGFVTDTKQYPPNHNSIELYFEVKRQADANTLDNDTFRLFDFYWPLPKQARFIFETEPTGLLSINFLVSGIGYGKTQSLIPKALTLARRNRGRMGMIVAPTYKMLQTPTMAYCLELLEECNVKYRYRKADGELELWGDTMVLLRSSDNYENLRGPNLAWVCGDELRNWDYEAFKICLGRIRDPKSKVREFAGVTTPWGFNWVYDIAEKGNMGELKNSDSFQIRTTFAKTSENIYLPPDFLDLVRATYDEDFAAQELDAQFLNIGTGRIYPAFDRTLHVKPCKYEPSLPLWIGQDFNVNPMASVLCQPHRRADGLTEVHVFDELAIKSANVQDTIKALEEKGLSPKTYRGELSIYPDATAWNENAAATRSANKQLQDAGYTLVSPRVNSLIRDRYASVNGKLRNANGIATLFIDPKCKSTVHDLEREVYQEGSPIRETRKDGAAQRGHHADALGYVIHRNFAIETGFKPQRVS